MIRERFWQRLAGARPPNVEPDPMALSPAPTRPGLECSWCRTIKTVGRRAKLPIGMASHPIATFAAASNCDL